MSKAFDFLRACGTFYLATVEGDQPRVRPFGAVAEYEGKLYIITNNQKDVYRQMLANPKVEICGMDGGSWIRVSGRVSEDTRREARAAMLEANESLTSMYDADDGLMVVFRFDEGTATIASFTDDSRSFEL